METCCPGFLERNSGLVRKLTTHQSPLLHEFDLVVGRPRHVLCQLDYAANRNYTPHPAKRLTHTYHPPHPFLPFGNRRCHQRHPIFLTTTSKVSSASNRVSRYREQPPSFNMTPDLPERQSNPSKRHRRSRSVVMTSQEVIDLTHLKDNEAGSSRKHDRNDKDTQVDGPSKRPKLKRDSEPPMRKDKSMTPKAKRKELNKEINNRKASRTSDHKKLKERAEALERDLANERRVHHNTKQELGDANLKLKEKIRDLECKLTSARQAHDDTQQDLKESIETLEEELKNARQAHDDDKKELEIKKQDLRDEKQNVTSKISELKDVRNLCDSMSEDIRKQQATIETDRQELHRLKAVVDDFSNDLLAVQKSCQAKDERLKAKEDHIAALLKELDDSKAQVARLGQALAGIELALKISNSNLTNCRNELVKREEKLRSTEQDRDEAKEAREKAENDAEALHRINEDHGSRINNLRARERKAKENLKSEKAELETKLQAKLESQKELNQMIVSLQQKLKAYSIQSQRYNYKEPDETILKDFAALESKIRQFIDKIARPVLNATDHELNSVWPNWSPELRHFLTSPLLCNLILEAYVWECLTARIFAPGSDIWAGELGQSLDKTLDLAAGKYAPSPVHHLRALELIGWKQMRLRK